jgi:hypothetical protein
MAAVIGRFKPWLWCVAAVVVLAAPGAQAQKQRSTSDALQDPDAQPGQSTPRARKPSTGPDRTGDALKDADAQPDPGTPRARKPSTGPNRTSDALKDPEAQPGQSTPRR